MTEVSFARTFLSTLDSKPTKIPADHVEDPRSYPSRPPSILPRQQKPFAPSNTTGSSSSSHSAAPGSEPSLTVTLKSLRNPPLDLTLTSQPPTTSVLDIKHAVAAKTGLPVDKIKLLSKKKPVADSKVLKELLVVDDGNGSGTTTVEFSVMVLGGAATLAAASASAAAAAAPAATSGGEGDKTAGVAPAEMTTHSGAGGEDKHVAVGLSGTDVLRTEEFWTDLGGYLQQRIRDEKAAGDVLGKFREAWQGR